MTISKNLRFPWNSDSHVFVGVASKPAAIFDSAGAGGLWQSRPLFVALGAMARAWWQTAFDATGIHPRLATEDVAGWLGFVLLNLVVTILAIAVFVRLAGAVSAPFAAVAAFAAFLAFNQVGKVFYWNAHTQMFNVLVPVLSIAWSADALAGAATGRTTAARILAAGVLTLAYGSFMIVAASVSLADAFRRWKRGAGAARTAARLLGAAVLWAAPVALWYAWARAAAGRLYSREAERYHEFVWIRESLREHRFLRAAGENAGKFLASIPLEVGIAAAVLLAVVLLLRARGFRADWSEPARVLVAAGTLVLALTLAFYGSMGFYAARLSWNLFPVLLVLVLAAAAEGVRTGKIAPRALAAAAWTAAAGNAVFWVVHPGPWC
jgi:hypothetical protein